MFSILLFAFLGLTVPAFASPDNIKRDYPSVCGKTGTSCYTPYKSVTLSLIGAAVEPEVSAVCSLLCKLDATCESFAYNIGVLVTTCNLYNGQQSSIGCFGPLIGLIEWIFYDLGCPDLPGKPTTTTVTVTYTKSYNKTTYTKSYTKTYTTTYTKGTTKTITKTAGAAKCATIAKLSTVTRTQTVTQEGY